MKDERQQIILSKVMLHNRVLLSDLSDLLNVSIDTIRRDVKELDSEKKLKKVHGGAVSLGYNNLPYKAEEVYFLQKKIVIAKKAINFLRDDQVVLIGGGTTNIELIKAMPHKIKLTVFTPSLIIASKLMSFPNVEVNFIGGKISKEAQISYGGSAIKILSNIKVDICFLGTGNIDSQFGISELDWEIVQVKQAMVEASKKTILLTISEKLNSVQRFKICEISEIHTLITELDPEDRELDAYRKDVEIL
ncbi:DeoR/GlpR family DNA-binding transcription regulator [Christiangramia echinicola]|uniref:DeoR/GlpR family DNA-binding transcription regulator n=1 Tax=Christiangramia echinicola TaxID=279359 RepID=UPI000479B09B|nr:DeoR/GlpR family DNA-binding transcription regulator [Christiangramia echinicola]